MNPFGYVALYLYYTDDDGNMAVGPRILVPANGIWMPRDPIGFAGGSYNEFQYVGNEPVGLVDPFGLLQSGRSTKDPRYPSWYGEFAVCVNKMKASGYGAKNACIICKAQFESRLPKWTGKWPDCNNPGGYPV